MSTIHQAHQDETGSSSRRTEWTGLVVPALFCTLLWGSAPALIKSGYAALQVEGTGSILLFAGLRFALAGLLVLLFWALQHKCQPASDTALKTAGFWKAAVILSLLQTFGQYMFYYLGAAHASGIMVSVLSGTSALFALMAACWLFHTESMTPLKLTGCLLGLAGIICMNLQGLSFSFSWNGEGMVLISQVLSALSACAISLFSRRYSAVLLSGWQFVIGGAAMALCGLGMNGHLVWSPAGIMILLWLAFVSAGAYTLWGVLLSRFPVSSVGIFACMTPVFGMLFSWIFLHEIPGWNALAALVLIAAGIFCINRRSESGKAGTDPEKKDAAKEAMACKVTQQQTEHTRKDA